MIRHGWRPRCCHSCDEPLEEWKTPLEPGCYVACFRCARMYQVDVDEPDTLTPVLLQLEAPELQLVFNDLLAAWWARAGAGQQLAVNRDGTTERKAA